MSFKFLALGDNHFNERSRFAECVRVHQWVVELARTEKPNACLLGGDLFDTIATDRDFYAASDFLHEMCEICDTIIVQGNHDYDKDFADLDKERRRQLARPRTADHYSAQRKRKTRSVVVGQKPGTDRREEAPLVC